MDSLFQCYCIPYISLYSELIYDLFLFYSPIPAGGMTAALSHHSSTNLHSTHTSTRLHKLADTPNILQPAHSFIHSFIPSSSSCATLLFLCATVPRHALHQYLDLSAACLSRPLGPSHFHSYYALCCFHAGSVGGWSHRWRDDFMLQQQKWEEQAATSLRAYLSLN